MSLSWDAWAELLRDGSWQPAVMTGPHTPEYIVAGSQNFVLLNALGPFGYGDRLD